MQTDPPGNPTPPPSQEPAPRSIPIPPPPPPPLDTSKPPPSEWAAPLRILGMIVATLVAANVGFFGTCLCTAEAIGNVEGAMTVAVVASVISAGGVLYALWPRKKKVK